MALETPFLDDGDVQLYHGDVIETLRGLPAGVAQACVTSPPYWGLRDYGTGEWTGGDADCDHKLLATGNPDRPRALNGKGVLDLPQGIAFKDVCGRCGARRVDSQIGLEASPDLYVERMVSVFREVWRVLRDDGTVWLNLGDSYNGSGGAGGNANETRPAGMSGAFNVSPNRLRDRTTSAPTRIEGGLKPKDLVGIPWRVAFALQADGWYLRSDIIWSKPNPMPESVSDRPTKAHEYLFLLSKQPRYFYDADAIREDNASPEQAAHNARYAKVYDAHTERVANGQGIQPGNVNNLGIHARGGNTVGRNRRSVWVIPTEPFPEAHFATYPQALVRPCILAGTSERGECVECGAPWMRETATEYVKSPVHGAGSVVGRHYETGANGWDGSGMPRLNKEVTTTGWRASCTCDALTRPQTVLDPFIGSGTTALVARNHGRCAIGIDLSSDYLQIAAKRLQQLSLLGGVV